MGNTPELCKGNTKEDNIEFGSHAVPDIELLRHSKVKYPVPKLSGYNQFKAQDHDIDDQIKRILGNDPDAIKTYGSYLVKLNTGQQKFSDDKFKISKKEVCYSLDRYYSKAPIKSAKTKSKDLLQKYKEYTYLTSVFCFIADNPQIIRKILLNDINKFGFYIIRFYASIPGDCPLLVVVDDLIPTQNNDPKYSHILTFSPWVYLIQKAWAKMLQSYENARGLSPQDAIQEIIGIPSYSYGMHELQLHFTKPQSLKKNYLYLFTAKDSKKPNGIYYHQVFYLIQKSLIGTDVEFQLQCPYNNFNFEGEFHSAQIHNPQNLTGTIKMSQKELLENFEYMTIGYYEADYKTDVYYLDFNNQNVVGDKFYIKFKIQKEEEISIRVVQYYEAYINHKQYEYSPVYIKLFNTDTMELIAEGCARSEACTKSANVFKNVMQTLPKGEYFLVIQIEWIRPDIVRNANLVFYSSQSIVDSLINMLKLEAEDIYKDYIINLFHKQFDRWGQLQYKVINKKKSLFMLFRNPDAGILSIDVNFPRIQNLRPVEIGSQKPTIYRANTLELRLPKETTKVFEFRKVNPTRQAFLGIAKFIQRN